MELESLGEPGGGGVQVTTDTSHSHSTPPKQKKTKKNNLYTVFLKSFYLSGTCNKIIEFQMNEICIPERIHN